MTERSGHDLLKSMAALGFVAIIGTALLAGVYEVTRERIQEQERRAVLDQLQQIIPPKAYDNALQDDRFIFRDNDYFPRGQAVTAYRAREDDSPVAVILRFTAVNGYSGGIGLLAGINYDGTVAGVRVVSHKETPGLGDAIEVEKSPWIRTFDGKSLGEPPPERWAVRRDGGDFDQLTGATITPRAVVEAVRKALEFFQKNRQFLFETPADTETMVREKSRT